MNINQLLMAQHREAEKLFEQLEDADPGERAELSTTLASKLELHMELEEEIVYPAICTLVEDSDEEVAEARAEHALARQAIQQLLALDEETPGFDGLVAMLKAGVLHHVEEEEEEVLPNLAESATKEQLEDLARQCEERIAAAGGRSPRGSIPTPPPGQSSTSWPKAAGVDGRSDMTRDEPALEDA